jgi:hypothetical protein
MQVLVAQRLAIFHTAERMIEYLGVDLPAHLREAAFANDMAAIFAQPDPSLLSRHPGHDDATTSRSSSRIDLFPDPYDTDDTDAFYDRDDNADDLDDEFGYYDDSAEEVVDG